MLFLLIIDNPIGDLGIKIFDENLEKINFIDINLERTSITDNGAIILTEILEKIGYCSSVLLSGNYIGMKGLKSLCKQSLKKNTNPFIIIKSANWTEKELRYYLEYCNNKNRYNTFSCMNINDSHLSLIKHIKYTRLTLSNNHITSSGLEDIMNCISKDAYLIDIDKNPIGDDGVEIICKFIDKFVDRLFYKPVSLNISYINMTIKGLKLLINRLKEYYSLKKIDISGNELDEKELTLMKNNSEVFEDLDELSVTFKKDIHSKDIKSFMKTFSSVKNLKIVEMRNESGCILSESPNTCCILM